MYRDNNTLSKSFITGMKCGQKVCTCIKKHKFITLLLGLCFITLVLISIGFGIVVPLYSTKTETLLRQGDVVELENTCLFWYGEISVSELKPDERNKINVAIYFVFNCGSYAREKTANSTSPFLLYNHPEQLDENLYGAYLLKGSLLMFEANVNLNSDLTHPIKLCRFSNDEYINALIMAKDIAEIEKAEKKGKCYNIERTSQKTFIEHSIDSHGYYFYAISAFSTKGGVNLSYSYELMTKYYNESDFTLADCSVIDDDCEKKDLLNIEESICVLAYTPIPSSEDVNNYTFTTTLSHAYGIIITVLVCSAILLILSIPCLVVCIYGLVLLYHKWQT